MERKKWLYYDRFDEDLGITIKERDKIKYKHLIGALSVPKKIEQGSLSIYE